VRFSLLPLQPGYQETMQAEEDEREEGEGGEQEGERLRQ
jgi:hypothetical protein